MLNRSPFSSALLALLALARPFADSPVSGLSLQGFHSTSLCGGDVLYASTAARPQFFPLVSATIYSVSGRNAVGQTIGIVGRSRTDFADFEYFSEVTGSAEISPTEVVPIAYGGVDPGPALTVPPAAGVSIRDQGEATLDVLRAGSVAIGANLLLVVATETSGGIEVDAQYLVDTTPVPAQVRFNQPGEHHRRQFCDGYPHHHHQGGCQRGVDPSQASRSSLVCSRGRIPGLFVALRYSSPARSWRSMLGMFALLLVLAGGALACGGAGSGGLGGGGGGGGGGGTGNPGTTPGYYTITVTGTSGTAKATGTVFLDVD